MQLFGHTNLVATDVVTAMLLAAEWQREQRSQHRGTTNALPVLLLTTQTASGTLH